MLFHHQCWPRTPMVMCHILWPTAVLPSKQMSGASQSLTTTYISWCCCSNTLINTDLKIHRSPYPSTIPQPLLFLVPSISAFTLWSITAIAPFIYSDLCISTITFWKIPWQYLSKSTCTGIWPTEQHQKKIISWFHWLGTCEICY